MTSRWLWRLRQITRRIWFRASLFSLAAVGTALLAIVVSPYIPSDLPTKIGADAVDNILGIIASSMLTVTTFSLSTMVSAYSAATSNVTPRATTLVMEDTTTQNVLATFVGSFLYSLVGIIALSTGAYGDRGRVVLFVVTIAVIILIVVTLLRWIDHLSRLGRVTETTQRVEEVAIAASRERRRNPHLGGRPLLDAERDIPSSAVPLFATTIGYLQHVDMAAISEIATRLESDIYLRVLPGDFIEPTSAIASVGSAVDDDAAAEIEDCFTIGEVRSFEQDPRFGCAVLTEIASRALSPGINDPGTAIDVIGRAVRILSVWAEPRDEPAQISCPNVHVPPLDLGDLFDDLFTPIARDGAGTVEIGLRLQKALAALSRFDAPHFREHARRHSHSALRRAEAGLSIEEDRVRIRRIAAQFEGVEA